MNKKNEFIGMYVELIMVSIAFCVMFFLGTMIPGFGWFLFQDVTFWTIFIAYIAYGIWKVIKVFEFMEKNDIDLDNLFD